MTATRSLSRSRNSEEILRVIVGGRRCLTFARPARGRRPYFGTFLFGDGRRAGHVVHCTKTFGPRPLPLSANWCCRSVCAIRCRRLVAPKRLVAHAPRSQQVAPQRSAHYGRQPQRALDGTPVHYKCQRLEQSTLCRLAQLHAAAFFALAEDAAGADLAQFVKDEFDAFLKCGILARGFVRLRCGDYCHDKLVAFSCKRRAFCTSCGARARSCLTGTVQATRRHGHLESAASKSFRDRWNRAGDQGSPRRRRMRSTILGGAVNAQRFSATFKVRLTRVEGRVQGARGKEKCV